MTDTLSLIERLEEAKHGYPNHPRGVGYDEGLDTAIAIVRRHYEGRPAVEGKPLELQTRDELLAYIRGHQSDTSLSNIIANLLREECRYDGDGYRFRRPSELAEKIIAAMERSSCGRAQIDKVKENQQGWYPVDSSSGATAVNSGKKSSTVNGQSITYGEAVSVAVRDCPSEIRYNDRKQFEDWHEAECYPCELSYRFAKDSDGDYTYPETAVAWSAWQAAKRYSEPVSVDLEAATTAIEQRHHQLKTFMPSQLAKACAKTWGLKWE